MELLLTRTKPNITAKDMCIKCGICGDPHLYHDCKYVILTNRICNKIIPTRARLSLPDILEIKKLADESSSVFSKSLVEVGTEFGPFIAKRNLTLNPSSNFPIKLFIDNESDLSEYFLDTTDENECCWMMFVSPASDVEEQNLICYQDGEDIYFGSIKDIQPREELKVWYAPYYAFKMQKSTLTFKESSKLQIESEINKYDAVDLNALIREQQKIVPRVVWNCKFCYKLEKNVTDFARHLMSHYSYKKICEHCDQRFRYKEDYRKHLKLRHNDNSQDKKNLSAKYPHVITKAEEQSSNSGLKSNTIGGPLLLQVFNDSLDNSNSLMQQPDVSFEMENYENQNMLLDGENLRLNVDVIGNHSMKDLEDFSADVTTKELKVQEFICDICLRKFATPKSIYIHLKLHMGKYFCRTCEKVFARRENLKRHKCNKIYSLKCPKCEKIFYQKKYLVKHMSIVHDKKYLCAECNKLCYSSSELKNHICRKVPKEKRPRFTCKLCLRKFSYEKNLKAHIKAVHSIIKNKQDLKLICSECSSTFSSEISYRRHLMCVHRKTRNFECNICDKKFSRKDILKSHMSNVHGLWQGKVSKCLKCNKEFKSKRTLDSHLKSTHSDSQFKCTCGSIFKYSRNLIRHQKKVHKSNEILAVEMHKCPLCITKVKLKRSLHRHIRLKHPGEYRNICVNLNVEKEKKKKIGQKFSVPYQELRQTMSALERRVLKNFPKEYKPDINIAMKTVLKQKRDTKLFDDEFDSYIDTDQKCMDLQQTIENMDFSIDNLLSGSETIDKFLKESSEQISIMFTESPKNVVVHDTGTTVITDRISNREVCLSMPDLSEVEQEINRSKC